ncbi:MAG TPA: hypothetical protein VIM10_06940 [Actinopolymorphaceae bacterium]
MNPPTDRHRDDAAGGRARFRRPLFTADAEQLSPVTDDRTRLVAAHRSAAALVAGARGRPDGEVAERLGNFVADEGIIELAALWAEAPAVSLPGALYQLVLLREWIVRNPVDASRFFTAGREVAEFSTVVAGVADPPSPEAVVRLADTVLSAAFDADLADALDRAGAFCRVVAAGRGHATPVDDTVNSRLGAGNLTMADNLIRAARAWRLGRLD